MNRLVVVVFLMFLAYGQVTAQGESARKKHFNLKNGVALSGYDPVSYFKGGPVKGKESLSYLYKGILYHFGSQANLEAFKASPERYEPSYGGWCAYAMGATGEKVSINPETFKIIDDKLYLFYNQFFTNTLTSWNKDEASLHKKADAQWNRTIHHISQ